MENVTYFCFQSQNNRHQRPGGFLEVRLTLYVGKHAFYQYVYKSNT